LLGAGARPDKRDSVGWTVFDELPSDEPARGEMIRVFHEFGIRDE
jgi:hypothetical protein